MSLERNKDADQLCDYNACVFEYENVFFFHDVAHIICIIGIMQYAMYVRILAINSSRQPPIRALKLNEGPCW